jgi:DNA-directed RNA polymerase subunit K/omega
MSDNEDYDNSESEDVSDDERDPSYIPDKPKLNTKIVRGVPVSSDNENEDDDENDESSVDSAESMEEEDSDIDMEMDDERDAEEVFNEPKKGTKKTKSKQSVSRENTASPSELYDLASDDEDIPEDDDETGEKYLQKFDEFTKQSAVSQYHPELLQHNHDEIDALCVVVRNSDGVIVDPLHRTLPFLTKYERARILGERAKQIDSGATPLIPVDESLIDSYLIAVAELEQKRVPFIIKRPLPNGGCEYWKLSDLEFI